jgi:DnaJ-class molecular chaperone
MKCTRCDGRGGGYETCEGIYPDLNYYYVDIGECKQCNGTGEIEDSPDGWDDD